MAEKIGLTQADLDKTWARDENDWIFTKYASSEEKKKYHDIVQTRGRDTIQESLDYRNEVALKYYDQAKKDYQASQAKKAEEARKKAEEAKAKAQPQTDYEKWKAQQPTANTEKGWATKFGEWCGRNWEKIVGISGLVAAGVGAVAGAMALVNSLTPQLKNLLSTLKDAVKNKKEPTPEEQKEIDKNPKSVSMKMYSFIRDSEVFTPYVQSQGYSLKLGFGYIVETSSPYYVSYPTRDDEGITEEYLEHVQDGTLDEWLKNIKPSLAPKDMIYELFNRDIQSVESIVNKEITDTILEQHEFDALVSFLWTMRDEGKIYPEYSPERLIKEIHSLIYYDSTKQTVAAYMKDVDKILVQSSKVWNRRQSEVTLFLTGDYECLNMNTLEKIDYEEIFSDMKNEYLVDKTGNKTLENYNTFVGNDSVLAALGACSEKNIILPESKKVQSTDEILNSDIVSKMIYPVLLKPKALRKGYDNSGIVNVDTICYGWFGSERGEGQGLHYGTDLVCQTNNPIVLPYSGTVEFIGMATETTEKLRRIVFRPDFNKDIVISLYYLVNLQVTTNTHYEAGKLVGYIGDCSELFDTVRLSKKATPYDFLHIQANYTDENGTPLNLTKAILNSTNAEEPEEITNLKATPILERAGTDTNISDTIKVTQPGKYQIVLVGRGGNNSHTTLNPVSDIPVTEASPFKYSLVGTNGACVIVNKTLEVKTYNYVLGGNTSSSFNDELICEKGKDAKQSNIVSEIQQSALYTIPRYYTVVQAIKGNMGITVNNICGYDVQTGETVPFEIKAGLAGTYNGYGKGGSVGLNGASASVPTKAYIKIQYLDWN